MMLLDDFDYDLPRHFIAQRPAEPRDHSKLMVMKEDVITHRLFFELPEYFGEDDVIVLNDTKVIPARLNGRKSTGGKVELLVINFGESSLEESGPNDDKMTVECLVKGKVRPGTDIDLESMPLSARIIENIEEGRYSVTFMLKGGHESIKRDTDSFKDTFIGVMEQYGRLPLPPYIKYQTDDPDRYQTVYSNREGSIAAPTAGLHFTDKVIKEMEQKGVSICYLTLHISFSTFKPVRVKNVMDHKMDFEYYQVSSKTAEILNEARGERRLTAVGTTAVRTLETIFKDTDTVTPCEGTTDLFIYPGFKFNAGIDRLVTNFHFPRSTLVMLVSAFAGKKRLFNAYENAKQNNYRFFSFGDSMFIMDPDHGKK